MTAAILGYGSLFQTWNGTGWVTLAEASAMSLPPLSKDVIDAGHESAPGEWRDVVTGLKSAGEISVSLNFIASEYQARYDDLNSVTFTQRRILLPDDSIYPFNAHLVGLETGVAVGERIAATAKFKVIGQPGPLLIGVPFADGEPPALYADFVNQFYFVDNTYFDNFDEFNAAVSGTFLRNQAGLVFDSVGVGDFAAINVPRFDHTAVGASVGTSIGLLMEDARVNWILNSLTMSSIASNGIAVTSTDHPAPYPPATVKKCSANGSDTAICYQFNDSAMSPKVSTTIVMSFYVWIPTDASISSVALNNESSTAPWSVKSPVALADLSKRDQWQRVWGFLQSDNTGTGNALMVLRLTSSNPGSIIYTTMWQIEHGTFPSSWIPTAGAAVTRAADAYTFSALDVQGFAADFGTLLSYNALPYTPAISDGLFRAAFLVRDGGGTNRAAIFKLNNATGEGHIPISAGGVSQMSAVSTNQPWLATTPSIKSVVAWKFNDAIAILQGIHMNTSPDVTVNVPVGLTTFDVAPNSFMLVRAIAYWPKRISTPEAIRLTT